MNAAIAAGGAAWCGLMNLGILVSLGAFAVVILIVALLRFVKLHDAEVAVHWSLHKLEMEHRAATRQLDETLKRIREQRD